MKELKVIKGTDAAIVASLRAQFVFGAKLAAFPRVDRWDPILERLQTLRYSDKALMDAWTYRWQDPIDIGGGQSIAAHIDEYGYRTDPMIDVYPASLFGTDRVGDLPIEEESSVGIEGESSLGMGDEVEDTRPTTGEIFLETYGHLSSTEYVTQEIIDKDENIEVIDNFFSA